MGLAPYLVQDTLGPALPPDQRPAAALWGLAQLCAMSNPEAVGRAGHSNGDELFDAIMSTPSGIVFTSDDWDDVWHYVRRADNRFTLPIPELLNELSALPAQAAEPRTDEFPFVLSAGERRSFTANTIFRDPQWRRRDPEGALRISAEDAARLGLEERTRRTGDYGPGDSYCPRGGQRDDAGGAHITAQRLRTLTPRGSRRRSCAERAHRNRSTRPDRRHSVAQERSGARREGVKPLPEFGAAPPETLPR